MIRAALHVARRYRDEETGKQARQLLARLAGDRFQLAVTGQFSRGKSTLMNAILGGAYAHGRAADDVRGHYGPLR